MTKVIDQLGWPVVALGVIWGIESLLNIAMIVREWI
jgi:hypothetical protein